VALGARRRGARRPARRRDLAAITQSVDQGRAALIDTREQDERKPEHVREAIVLPLSAVNVRLSAAKLAKLPTDTLPDACSVVGKRTLSAGNAFEQHGC